MELKQYSERTKKEKNEMWDEIAKQLAKPKSDRPQQREMYDAYGIPEATYYWKTGKTEFKQQIVDNCLSEAKLWMPELVEVLRDKALVDRSEKSIEMAFKYIANVAERFDHTTKNEKITGFTYVNPTKTTADNEATPSLGETKEHSD